MLGVVSGPKWRFSDSLLLEGRDSDVSDGFCCLEGRD